MQLKTNKKRGSLLSTIKVYSLIISHPCSYSWPLLSGADCFSINFLSLPRTELPESSQALLTGSLLENNSTQTVETNIIGRLAVND